MTLKHPITVVDLGCANRGEWFSLEALAEKYKPEMIYGFDPSPNLNVRVKSIAGTPCKLVRKAAWLYDGTIAFDDELITGRHATIGVGPSDPSTGRIGVIGEGPRTAKCFDFSAWMKKLGPAVVKMDVEGAEFALLDKLLVDGTAELIRELVIEWHDEQDAELVRRLRHVGVSITPWWM